jgi:hypothetical protein
MNGQVIGGMCPLFNLAFSLEEAPTFGRVSSLSFFNPLELNLFGFRLQ